MAIYPESRAVVIGMGPVGVATACALKMLNPDVDVIALEKRKDPTRHHSLSIQNDSIQRLVQTLELAKVSEHQKVLISELKSWKNRAIPTTYIQDKLTQFAEQIGVRIFKGVEHDIDSQEDLDSLLKETKAQVVIAADGAHSKVRQLIGAKLVDEFTLGYLLELKYKVPEHISPRDFSGKITQASIAEGFDFETAGRKVGADGKKTFSLHKFIDKKTHKQLKKQQGEIERGTSAHPWTVQELKGLGEEEGRREVTGVYQHLTRYLRDHDIDEKIYSEDRVATFPLTIYRSNRVAANYKGRFILLSGDSSSGLVLERGVNKGFIEAALSAEAVSQFFRRSAPVNPRVLPREFQAYQTKARNIFFRESKWARIKFYGLKAGEYILKTAVRPFKWAYKNVCTSSGSCPQKNTK